MTLRRPQIWGFAQRGAGGMQVEVFLSFVLTLETVVVPSAGAGAGEEREHSAPPPCTEISTSSEKGEGGGGQDTVSLSKGSNSEYTFRPLLTLTLWQF